MIVSGKGNKISHGKQHGDKALYNNKKCKMLKGKPYTIRYSLYTPFNYFIIFYWRGIFPVQGQNRIYLSHKAFWLLYEYDFVFLSIVRDGCVSMLDVVNTHCAYMSIIQKHSVVDSRTEF